MASFIIKLSCSEYGKIFPGSLVLTGSGGPMAGPLPIRNYDYFPKTFLTDRLAGYPFVGTSIS